MTVEVHWDINIQCRRCICTGAYGSNVKCLYASPSGQIIDFTEFLCGIYTDIVV